MSNRKHFQYDSGAISLDMLLTMHPAIVLMISWTNLWCHSNGIFPMWTSWKRTPEKNRELGATAVHEWRAADLSLKAEYGWNYTLRTRYEKEFRKKFLMMGALSLNKNNKTFRKPIVRHDVGYGDHFHLQCSPHAEIFNERSIQ